MSQPIPGTQGAAYPFWSPDSRAIGFFADGKLKRVPLSGGPAVPIADNVGSMRGATWNRNDEIVVGATNRPLQRVPAAGGSPTPVTTLQQGDISHIWPVFMPDGESLLFVSSNNALPSELRLTSIRTGEMRLIRETQSRGVYAAGHLLYVTGGRLVAQPFDKTRSLSAAPIPLVDSILGGVASSGVFSASTGSLAYARSSGLDPSGRLVWMHRSGTQQGSVGEPGWYVNLGLSRDERFVAVAKNDGPPSDRNRDIWKLDLARGGTAVRLTTHAAAEGDLVARRPRDHLQLQ